MPNSVLLFEDIDCMKGSKTRGEWSPNTDSSAPSPEKKASAVEHDGVTLSGLLNALDGLYAPTNVLVMMTTNRVETLDPALLRPGRIDYRLYLGTAGDRQKIELYRRFFHQASGSEAREFVEAAGSACTMAEFQGLLLAVESSAGSGPERKVASLDSSRNEMMLAVR